jgi:aspartate-semialdehyde dehydrogenase
MDIHSCGVNILVLTNFVFEKPGFNMKIAVVGATGLVGSEMVRVLEKSGIPVEVFIPVASERSIGKKVLFAGKEYAVVTPETAIAMRPHIAVFSAGAAASRHLAPLFANAGITVIDNSSAWRKDPDVPLVVPEINASVLRPGNKIIANPNCSTIQMVMVLAPLHRLYRIKRVVVATYQSVTGSGAKGKVQLEHERRGDFSHRFYPHQIDLNVIPHGGDFLEDGSTSEEEKLQFETCKIIGDETIKVTATVVRVPVYGGHSEAVNIEMELPVSPEEARKVLSETPGIIVEDDPVNNLYPMPLGATGRDEVFVGRIRKDHTVPHGLNMWVVSDNLRKGAATNAIQIAQYLEDHQMITKQ